VAAKGGDFGTTLGNILIPQTMAGLQNYGLKEKAIQQQQTQDEALKVIQNMIRLGAPMPAMQKVGALAFPEQATARAQEVVYPSAPKFMTFKPGEVGALVDTKGVVSPMYEAPDNTDKSTQIEKELKAAGLTPGTPEYQRAIMTYINKPATQVNMGGDKAVTGVDADRYKGTTGALQTLDQMAPFLERMKEAQSAGAQTGFGQDWLLTLKQGVGALTGEMPKGTSEQEVFRSVQNYLGPKMRAPGAGASSDKDVSLFLDSIPALSKSESGNTALFDMYGKIRNRTAEIARIQQSLLRDNNYIPIDQERKQIEALGPVFTADDRKAIAALKGSGAPASPGAKVIQSLPPDAVKQPDGTYTSPSYPGKIIRPQ
jgi:hypothetical protein